MIEIYPTGSRHICDPPVLDTDEDYVVYSDDSRYQDTLLENGWVSDTKYAGSDFTSYRRGSINYIVANTKEFYDKFVLATKIAKKLNLKEKTQRVTLFQGVLYGKCTDT